MSNYISIQIKFYLKMNKILFQTRLLEGTYPDTMRIIPTEFPVIIPFNKEELLQAVERVSLLSPRDRETNYNIIKMSLRPDSIVEISSTNNEIGDALEEVIPIFRYYRTNYQKLHLVLDT